MNEVRAHGLYMFNGSFLFLPATLGIIFLVAGLVMLKLPPRSRNWFYGYRTPNSMKSQERWDFAQIYAAKEMCKIGGLLLLTSPLGFFYNPGERAASIIAVGVLVLLTVVLVVRVEWAIRKKFPSGPKRT